MQLQNYSSTSVATANKFAIPNEFCLHYGMDAGLGLNTLTINPFSAKSIHLLRI